MWDEIKDTNELREPNDLNQEVNESDDQNNLKIFYFFQECETNIAENICTSLNNMHSFIKENISKYLNMECLKENNVGFLFTLFLFNKNTRK